MSAKTNTTKVLLIDDHPLLRQGIAALINQEKDLSVCGEIDDARKAISTIQTLKPDVVILDVSLKGASGIEVLKDIKAQFPKLKVLILSMHDESVYAQRALRSGASGYLMKQEATETVLTALRRILSDEVYVSPEMGMRLLNRLAGHSSPSSLGSPVEELSDRELEVFTLLGNGHGTRAIAEKLNLSVKTIESHRAHIKEKLNLEDAAELVHHAIQWTHSESLGAPTAATAR